MLGVTWETGKLTAQGRWTVGSLVEREGWPGQAGKCTE